MAGFPCLTTAAIERLADGSLRLTTIAGHLPHTQWYSEDESMAFLESWTARVFAAPRSGSGSADLHEAQPTPRQGCCVVFTTLQAEPQGSRCAAFAGEILIVARSTSGAVPLSGHWVGERLSAENHQLLWNTTRLCPWFFSPSAPQRRFYKASGL